MNIVKVYLRVLGLLASEKLLVGSLILSGLVIAVAQFAEPVLFGKIIDRLTRSQGNVTWGMIAPLAGIWIGFGLFNILASAILALQADRLSHRRRLMVMSQFFEHLLELPQSYHHASHTGRLLKIMLDGSAGLSNVWLSFLRENVVSFLSLLILLPATLFLNWRLSLLLILLVAISGTVIGFVIHTTQTRQQGVENFHSDIAQRAADSLGNVAAVQSFTRTREEADGLRKIGNMFLNSQLPILAWWAAATVITRAAATVTILLIFLFGTYLHMHNLASVGDIVTFIGLATLCIGKLEQVIGFINWIFMLTPKLEEFFEVVDTQPGIVNKPGAKKLGYPKGKVEFDCVSYSHDRVRPAIVEISLTAEPGEIVALVGETGAGKSTTAAALYRAFDPDSGRILIDGTDIRDIEISSLRSAIGIVFQEPMLFARTIADNLRLARPDATEEQMRNALEEAQAWKFVERLDKKLETNIGERGQNLSGGEKQRLSIARALLKDPAILILDEATSALDATTESAVQMALDQAMKGRTTLVIAHRLSTVRRANKIIVLKEGAIVEQGKYSELIAANGIFSGFAKDQFV